MRKNLPRTWLKKIIVSGLILIGFAGLTACSQIQATGNTPTGMSDQEYALDRLKRMSDALGAANQFQIKTHEVHEWMDDQGKRVRLEGTSTVDVVRPGKMKVTVNASGVQNLDSTLYFSDATLFFEGRNDKVWAAAATQDTIDAMLDEVAWRFDLPIPVSDFLYSSAYDSLVTDDTKCRWTAQVVVEGRRYDHFVFTTQDLEWEIWLNTDDTALPHQMVILRKDLEGDPRSIINFTAIDLNHKMDASEFIFTPKAGYTQITVTENPASETEAAPQGGE